jgi:hypothetical protein
MRLCEAFFKMCFYLQNIVNIRLIVEYSLLIAYLMTFGPSAEQAKAEASLLHRPNRLSYRRGTSWRSNAVRL